VKVRGRVVCGTADTAREARAAAVEAEYLAGRKLARVSFADLIVVHCQPGRYAPTTSADLASLLRRLRQDAPEVDGWDVGKVTAPQVVRMLGGLGWSDHRVKRLHTFLSAMWETAVRNGWADVNVIRQVPVVTPAAAEVRPPDMTELARVLDQLDGAERLFVRVAAVTGARRGEVCALQWADIDRHRVTIRRSVAHTNAGMTVGEGKTGRRGHRTVSVDQTTAGLMANMFADQSAAARSSYLPPPVWVFSHDCGVSPWRGDYMTHQWVQACRQAGVVGVRLHDVRHHVATMMLSEGVPIADVAARLGNSIRVVERVYAHHIPGWDGDIADRLGGALAP
jgi:integrase